jgi:hypothetical protein
MSTRATVKLTKIQEVGAIKTTVIAETSAEGTFDGLDANLRKAAVTAIEQLLRPDKQVTCGCGMCRQGETCAGSNML